MKSLLDIQQDIRALESAVQDISVNIKKINSDIHEFRNTDADLTMDYSMIEVLAKQIKFRSHPLSELEDDRLHKLYIEMLLSIVNLDRGDKEITINRLVFVQWILSRSKLNESLEELFTDSLTLEKNFLYELEKDIPTKYKKYLLVDALIVANISGNANREILEYLSDLSVVMGIDAYILHELSVIARVALQQSMVGLKRTDMEEVYRLAKSYSYYIESKVLTDCIRSLRKIVVEISDKEAIDFKWNVNQMELVAEGDLLATYKTSKHAMYTKKIIAPSSGTIYLFRDSCKNYGVLGHKNDNKDSIKAWVNNIRR